MRAGWVAVALIFIGVLSGTAHADRPSRNIDQAPPRALAGWTETGTASWYGRGDGFNGKPTASGIRFDTLSPMAAHRRLPFGSAVLVTNLENGRSTWVVIRDRGPFINGRIIDLSLYSAGQLGMVRAGTARVRIEGIR